MLNYLTENEARVKWCPLSRVAAADGMGIVTADKPAHNRAYAVMDHKRVDIESCNCIASACMFWQRVKVPVPFNSQNRNSSGEPISTIEAGYCGAANLPNSHP